MPFYFSSGMMEKELNHTKISQMERWKKEIETSNKFQNLLIIFILYANWTAC